MKHNFAEKITEAFKGAETFTTRDAAIALGTSCYVVRGTLENMSKSGRVYLVSKGKCGRTGIPATWKIPTRKSASAQPHRLQRLVRHLRGKSLVKYRHALLAEIKEAEGEMEHAAMRLGWERKWHDQAKSDLLKAGRKRGVALQRHWVTIGVESIKVKMPNGEVSEGGPLTSELKPKCESALR